MPRRFLSLQCASKRNHSLGQDLGLNKILNNDVCTSRLAHWISHKNLYCFGLLLLLALRQKWSEESCYEIDTHC